MARLTGSWVGLQLIDRGVDVHQPTQRAMHQDAERADDVQPTLAGEPRAQLLIDEQQVRVRLQGQLDRLRSPGSSPGSAPAASGDLS